MTILVRETPPLRLGVEVTAIGGGAFRWGLDEHDASNVPNGLSFSTTMPGGFDQASCELARRPNYDYPDLQEFETVTVYGVGGEVAWQGRLESVPRSSGQQVSITPGMVGWQAHLDDNKSAKMIYLDCDLSQWKGPSVARQSFLYGFGYSIGQNEVTTDPTQGYPSIALRITRSPYRYTQAEAWYDASGIPIQTIYYAWAKSPLVLPPYTSTTQAKGWRLEGTGNDHAASTIQAGLEQPAQLGPLSGSVPGSVVTTWAMIQFWCQGYPAGDTKADEEYVIYWTSLIVVGRHGMPITGGLALTPGSAGILGSDVVKHAVTTWAPKLAVTRAGVSTITPTAFQIPNCVFRDPTTSTAIITEACRYDLNDWWVDEGPTFNLASRTDHGRDWVARVGPSGLSETGPQASQIINSVIVRYRDVTGDTRSVGPTGSGADTIDTSLADADPANPATLAGLTRRAVLDMGIVSTPAGAIKIGQAFLAEQKLVSTAGQASIVGHVQDQSGTSWPAWAIRAGDRISFVDAHDTTPRRIVKTSYADSSKTNQIDLDAPPQGLDALLARFGGVITPYGL
jgi:hypothetical protein